MLFRSVRPIAFCFAFGNDVFVVFGFKIGGVIRFAFGRAKRKPTDEHRAEGERREEVTHFLVDWVYPDLAGRI